MRTTVSLDDDVLAAVNELRKDTGVGLSAAVNQLARSGLVRQQAPRPEIRLTGSSVGVTIDVSNVAEALEIAEGPFYR